MTLKRSTVTLIAAALPWLIVGCTNTTLDAPNNAAPESAAPAVTSGDYPVCEVSTLPAEAADTIEDINSAGPYDFPDNDNTRFGNYEGILPDEELGYYREYTVITPGLDHRGARRIATGGGTEADPDVWYYTDDHYETFCEIPDAEQ